MDFDEILEQAITFLRKRGRITYRSLRRQFDLQDDVLDDLCFELIQGQRLAKDEDGLVLVWTGEEQFPSANSGSRYTPRFLADGPLQDRTAHEGEIKQVTVLFCDIVESTALAERIGAEAMHDLLNSFFTIALGVVHDFGGTINSFLGDGFMALFGAPTAYEDHAVRAVRATVVMRTKLNEQRDLFMTEFGAEIKTRFGINTGKVVVGGIGDDLRMDYTAIGDTSNLASRLEKMSDPGEILISESTAFRARTELDLEPLAPRPVKGKTELIVAYRVLSVRRPLPLELRTANRLSSFQGRRKELEKMLEIAENLKNRCGHVITLRGGAGVGKSRLVKEFLDRVSDNQELAFFEGRCVSFDHRRPYHPFLEMIRQVAAISDEDSPEITERKVRSYLQARSMPPEEWAYYLLRLFGCEPSTAKLSSLSAEAVQKRTNQMFRNLTKKAAQLRPLVIFIEDLHWIDSASGEGLAEMLEVAQSDPVLFILTFRPDYSPKWLNDDNHNIHTHFDLQPLTAEEGVQLIRSAAGNCNLSEEMVTEIQQKADGIPFFIEQLTRAVGEVGPQKGFIEVPSTIEDVISSRIDSLPELTKRLLHTASVLGRSFTASLLDAVWSEGSLSSCLRELRDLDFLRREEGARDPSYIFVHALTQDVAYASILSSRRRAIHLAAGLALEKLYSSHTDDVLDRLGHHFYNADVADKAVPYLRSFAARAAQGYSHGEAARALQMALGHSGKLSGDDRIVTQLMICDELCRSLYFLGQFEDTIKLLNDCQELVDKHDEPSSRAIHHFWMGHTCSYLGRMIEAFDHARLSIRYAQASGNRLIEGRAAYVMERASFWSGNFPDAIRFGEQAIVALSDVGDRWWEGQSRWMIGWSHGAMGDFDQALAAVAQASTIGEEIEDPRLVCYAAWTSAVMLGMRGDLQEAITAGRRGLERSPDRLNTGVAYGFTGFAYLEAGVTEEAISMLSRGAALMEEMRFRPLLGWFSIWWGEGRLQGNDPDGAEELVQKGIAVCEDVRNLWGVGMGQRVLGGIADHRGAFSEARQHLQQAEETFSPLQAKYWLARTHLDMAKVAHDSGDADGGMIELEKAESLFAALQVPAWLRRTEALKRSLQNQPSHPQVAPAS